MKAYDQKVYLYCGGFCGEYSDPNNPGAAIYAAGKLSPRMKFFIPPLPACATGEFIAAV